jgi:carbonic anhydrase/acetyltransferase-like protein (isoleucine patch superfamily)
VPIYALGDLEPEIHPDACVHPDAVVIGRVTIGARSSVWPQAVLRGDVDTGIHIGARTSIQDGSVITRRWPRRRPSATTAPSATSCTSRAAPSGTAA